MNKKKSKNKSKKIKEHNSWLYVLWSLIIDTFFSFTKTGADAGDFVPIFDASDKLGEEGKRRQNQLIFAGIMIFCIAMILLCISLMGQDSRAAWAGIIIFAGLGIAAIVFKKNIF